MGEGGETGALPPALADERSGWLSRPDIAARALEACGILVSLGLATWLFLIPLHNATNYDEGNYLAAVTDLRGGFSLGKDVYADQPPGWYAALRMFAWLFGSSVTGVRTGLLIVAVVGVAAAWLCGRAFGPFAGVGAAALLIVSPPYAAQAMQIEADTTAAVLGVTALAAGAWAYVRLGSRALAALSGALVLAAVSVKLSATTALVPLAAFATARPRLLAWSAVGGLFVAAGELIAFRHQLGAIAHGVIGQHTAALGSSHWSRSTNVDRLLHYLNGRTPATWLVLLSAAASLWLARAGTRHTHALWSLWLFVPAGAAFILAMKPLLDHHIVILAVSIAVPAGCALGLAAERVRPDVAAAMSVVVALGLGAGLYQQHRQLTRNTQPEPAWVIRAADKLRALTRPHEIVVTDIPIIAYYAHRRLVPDFVDTSFTRLGVGELTPRSVLRQLTRYRVRVAAIGRTFWADRAVRSVFDSTFRRRKLAPNIVFYTDPRASAYRLRP